MEIYSDPYLDSLAIQIRDDIDEIGFAFENFTNPTKNPYTHVLEDFINSPVGFCKLFMDRNIPRLYLIRSNINSKDATLRELTVGLYTTLYGLLRFHVQNATMITLSNDLQQHLNDPEVVTIKKSLTEIDELLQDINTLAVPNEINSELENLKKNVKSLINKFSPPKSWW